MNKDKFETPAEPMKTSLSCPHCGGEVIANPVFNTVFCGVRIVAACSKGCSWSNEEQQEMNRTAGDEIYS